MNKLNILKSATGMIVSAGAGAIVGNAIKASTPADVKTVGKVLIAVGGFALTGMVGEMASKYTSDSIDEVAEAFNKTKNDPTEDDN